MQRETNASERHGALPLFRLALCLVLVLLASCSAAKSVSKSTTTSTVKSTMTSMPAPRYTATNPQPAGPLDIYAHSGINMFSAATLGARQLIYVPESMSAYVDVIDPATYRVIDRYRTGERPQHVVPAWDMRTLYASNNLGNSLTPIDPRTGKIAGPNIPVDAPYNLYSSPDGTSASAGAG